jgi:hypothetical protein
MLGKKFVLYKAGPVQGLLWHKKQKYYSFIKKKTQRGNVFDALFLCCKCKMAAIRPPFSP